MLFDPRAGITKIRSADNGRRRRGHVGLEAVRSDLGPVLDLSSSGMRVIARKVPFGDFMVKIRGLEGEIEVKARLAWSRRVGVFKKIAGIEFLEVSEAIARQLTRLGMTNRDRRTV